MKRIDEIANGLGFAIRRTSDNCAYYYLKDKDGNDKCNKRGETLCIEVSDCHGTNDKKSLPNIWYKRGYTKEPIYNYWVFDTYATDKNGRCYMAYNPTIKPSDDGKRFVINFDWHFADTDDNFEKVIKEIVSRFISAK